MSEEKFQSEQNPNFSFAQDLFQGEDPRAKIKELAEEASRFVQKHPLAAVAGALAVGYLLGRMNAPRRESK